ncbi:MAG: DNA glycosylase [Oscillospiraceae bacterium]|nr:DNA glycosylase [Oscillospiraceae bacterium]
MNNIQFVLNTDKIIYTSVGDYNLADTFECGQAFRFDPYNGGYRGFIEKQLCHITLQNENGQNVPAVKDGENATLTVQLMHTLPTESEAIKIGQFLSLDTDYTALKKQFAENEIMAKAIEFAPGIRVLNQDFFETLITFIISQNNNIPRIKQLCDRISEKYGTKVGDTCAFPTAEQMRCITEQDYKDMKFGFRAKYLADAVAKVLNGEVDEAVVKSLSYEDAQEYLMQIKGVGPKVADCVLLFSCRQYRSFPKDVWIKKAMAQLFPDGIPKEIEGYEGIAQQYIFHYARHTL